MIPLGVDLEFFQCPFPITLHGAASERHVHFHYEPLRHHSGHRDILRAPPRVNLGRTPPVKWSRHELDLFGPLVANPPFRASSARKFHSDRESNPALQLANPCLYHFTKRLWFKNYRFWIVGTILCQFGGLGFGSLLEKYHLTLLTMVPSNEHS